MITASSRGVSRSLLDELIVYLIEKISRAPLVVHSFVTSSSDEQRGCAAYFLNHVYDQLIHQTSRNTPTGCSNHHTWSRDQTIRSRNVVIQKSEYLDMFFENFTILSGLSIILMNLFKKLWVLYNFLFLFLCWQKKCNMLHFFIALLVHLFSWFLLTTLRPNIFLTTKTKIKTGQNESIE